MPVNFPLNPDAVPMGANIVPDKTGATFRCWAPRAKSVRVRGEFNAWDTALSDASLLHRYGDYWIGFVPGAKEGQQYKFFVEGELGPGWKRDPYARELTATPRYPFCNCVLRDPRHFQWHDNNFHPPAFNDLIIYQLHVGVFNGPDRLHRVATFLDLLGKIDYLVALGINAVLLLPVVEYASPRSLGYEGSDIFSPEMDYAVPDGVSAGQIANYLPLVNGLRQRTGLPVLTEADLVPHPDQLKAVVELFHLHGIAVLFDVVYNHAGGQIKGQPESLWFFDLAHGRDDNDSQYFTTQDHTGPVWAIWKQEVRQFLIDNATFFLKEYHADGFRYDQASVIVKQNDNDGWRFCQDLTETAHFVKPSSVQIAEYWDVNPYVVRFPRHGGAGFDACWHDGLRKAVRGAVATASAGREARVDMDAIAGNLWPPNFLNAWRAVHYVESHDEVYRDRGQRVPRLADGKNQRTWYALSRTRVAAGILLTAPGIPMVFMGQSFLEDKQWADDPSYYPGLLLWWDGLDWGQDRRLGQFHRFFEELVWMRRSQPALRGETLNVLHSHNDNRILVFHRWLEGSGQDVVVVASLNDWTFPAYEVPWPGGGRWREIFNSDSYDDYAPTGNGGAIEAWWSPRDQMPATARITIPSNTILVFAR
jgi:1,4-alpha-glucan branching enzyme